MITLDVNTQRTHYDVLQISARASKNEIQTAFRRLAKVYHPDKNPDRVPWAEARMRELLQAYKVVSDDQRRSFYDRKLGHERSRMTFSERMTRRDDPSSQAKLLLHHLLEGQFDQALDLHDKLRVRWTAFEMSRHMDECDYLDVLFLLGEAYENRRQYHTAARYYWEAYERESKGKQKRFFLEELKDRLRVLFSQRLIQGLSPEDALKNYERALPLCLGNREAALIYKKIALIQHRLGREDKAIDALNKAQKLCPRMKTIAAMRKKMAGA